MKVKLKYSCILLLFSILFSASAYSETELEAVCAESMAGVSVLSNQEKNTFKIYKVLF